MNEPLVTIGIPNYNYAHFIVQALESVTVQTYKNIEIIIVDDVSTDDSIAVINNWISRYSGTMDIRLIKNDVNLGLTKTCNVILNNASGKYFQTLDADDMLLPEKIEKQVALMETNVNAAFIYSNIGIIDENGLVINEDYLGNIGYNKDAMPNGKIFNQLFEFNFVPLPSVLVNREYAQQAGGFDESLQVQDYYLWLKLSDNHDVLYLPDNTAMYRQHASSMSNSNLTSPRSEDSILRLKYKYYKAGTPEMKTIVKKNILFTAAYLYEHNFSTATYWLQQNARLNPGLKNWGYYGAAKLGIPFSFFAKFKSKK